MLDWPNLIAGFILGVLGTLAFWLPDKARAKRHAEREARASWSVAAKQIELAAWQSATTSADLYRLRVQFPIDHWRLVLGGEDFQKLEALENAYFFFDHKPTEANAERLKAARIEFSNVARSMQSEDYAEALFTEDRKRIRRDYLSHPIRTWMRERHDKRARREAEMSP